MWKSLRSQLPLPDEPSIMARMSDDGKQDVASDPRRSVALVCQWCGFAGLDVLSEHIHLMNAQVSMEHVVSQCIQCERFTAAAQWGQHVHFAYRALEYKRRFR